MENAEGEPARGFTTTKEYGVPSFRSFPSIILIIM